MSHANISKRSVCILLSICIIMTCIPASSTVYSAVPEAGLLYSGDTADIITPSGTDPGIRVSYAIEGDTKADYLSEKTITVRFSLNKASDRAVSFLYKIHDGSAVRDFHYNGPMQGTISFGAGETEKLLELNINKLVNNPSSEYKTPSKPYEFWEGDRLFYINCSDISNALFDNDDENITISLPIMNDFKLTTAYDNACAVYLADMQQITGAESIPENPGRFLNTGPSMILLDDAVIGQDVRTMIDTGVFTHLNLPIGYFSSENPVTGDINFSIIKKFHLGSATAYDRLISMTDESRVDFGLGDVSLAEIGLGTAAEANGMILSLYAAFDYISVIDQVYSNFLDVDDTYVQYQMNFADNSNPEVLEVSAPEGSYAYGESIPVIVTYNEPVLADGISLMANGTELHPIERPGTISDRVSFLYKTEGGYEGTIAVTDITGAVDLSGKNQTAAGDYSINAGLGAFDVEKFLIGLGDTSVVLDQGESVNASGQVAVSIADNVDLSLFLKSLTQADGLLDCVKAKVIGQDGSVVDVPLYVNDPEAITELSGGFTAPANLTDKSVWYAAEIYLDSTDTGDFKLLYPLSELYEIKPIIYIDDATDLEIQYPGWPAGDKIAANSEDPISLGYQVNNEATWQRAIDFKWTSSDTTVAAIASTGVVALTGKPGTVAFTLTALNAGLPGKEFAISSRELVVTTADASFLSLPSGTENIETSRGSSANIYFSTNLTANNALYAGAGTATAYTFKLFTADYDGSILQRGALVYQQILEMTEELAFSSYTVDAQHMTNTSVKGKYSYILEVSAKDLWSDKILSASANICVKELPAAAALNRPPDYYVTDETGNLQVSFSVGNLNAATEVVLSVFRNEAETPIYTTSDHGNIGKELSIAIDPVDSSRLMDVYTVLLKAKNEFDEAASYDSYILYVYNSDALKIMVNGIQKQNLEMGKGDKFSSMTSEEILALDRKIIITDEISINNKEYRWSSIADKITWEVGAGGNVSLKYKDGRNNWDIKDINPATFLPGSSFMLSALSGGETNIIATHVLSGMKAKLDITVDKLEERLYLFQTYPMIKNKVAYQNGNGNFKTAETDDRGRIAIYEESGIKSDVSFTPMTSTGLYGIAVLSQRDLLANQTSSSDYSLYPQNNVTLPVLKYNAVVQLSDEYWRSIDENMNIRAGVYRNGYYCPNATVNGKIGSEMQLVSPVYSAINLEFNGSEFTSAYESGPLSAADNIEYVIEISFPDNSRHTKFVKVDKEDIRWASRIGSCAIAKAEVKQTDPSKIQNGINIITETITINGKTYDVNKPIVMMDSLQSAVFDIDLMMTGEHSKKYSIFLFDEYKQWAVNAAVEKQSYEFTDNVSLKGTANFTSKLADMKNGEVRNLYGSIGYIENEKLVLVQLPKPITIAMQTSIPCMESMSGGALKAVAEDIKESVKGASYLNFTEDNDHIKASLDFLAKYSIDSSSIRLEVEPTEDPLVYKGTIKFAAGDITKDNPSGVYLKDDGSAGKFKFLPGVSDVKAMSKGDYLKKSVKQLDKNMGGYGGKYKKFGGGAYLECEVFYDIYDSEWKIRLLNSITYLGAGGGYQRNYNAWVGPVPVTAEFMTGMSAVIDLTTMWKDSERKYITLLNPYYYIYGFGGFGGDYEVVSLKVGPYGMIDLDQRFLWLNSESQKKNGQKITVSGETGVSFEVSLLWAEYAKKYKLGGYSKSWKYNKYDEIAKLSDSIMGFSMIPVEESAGMEDRAYLESSDREWTMKDTVGLKSFAAAADDGGINVILTNAYPKSDPVMTEDGELLVYLSDMGSKDINDTAVCFSSKTGGTFPEGIEIHASDYADADAAVDGTIDGAAVAWVRARNTIGISAGEEITEADAFSMMSGTEIMAGIYNGTAFATTRLTDNSTPDMAPAVATNGHQAIVAWRSLYAGDMDKPLEFSGRDAIMYSIYDGTSWSAEQCLYDGSTDHVQALNVEMMSDGTSAVTYQIRMDGTDNTEIICAVLDNEGNVINSTSITNNESRDEKPRIAAVEFPDGVERFLIGWNATKLIGDVEEKSIRIAAVSSKGLIYTGLDMEIENIYPASNYNSFKFTDGAKTLDELSIVWSEPKIEPLPEGGGSYRDIIWGMKFMEDKEGGVAESSKIKLLELDDLNMIDFFSSCVDSESGDIYFSLLMSDHSGTVPQSIMADAAASYKSNIVIAETGFSYGDVLPGTKMPVLFRLYNEGVEPINSLSIELGGVSHLFDMVHDPGEYMDYTVLYTVPDTVEDPEYTVTANFVSSIDKESGTLTMDIPDVGLDNIVIIKEAERERTFAIPLYNDTYSRLKEGKNTVRLQVFDTPDFAEEPIKTELITDAESLNMINEGKFIKSITLGEAELQGILDENGELPEGGAMIFFRVVLEEMGSAIADADISNDSDYTRIYSLLEKNKRPVSIQTSMEAESGHTIVQIAALNNSMNEIKRGNFTVILRDSNGNVVDTKQSYDATAVGNGLVTIGGEETCEAAFSFSKAGASSEVIYSTVSDGSNLLADLKFTGVPLDFKTNTYTYSINVKNLNTTVISAVAENPASIVSIYRNGMEVSSTAPCSLTYGSNNFRIVVKTGLQAVVYTIGINKTGNGYIVPVEHDDDDNDRGGNSYNSLPGNIPGSDPTPEGDNSPDPEYENPFKDVLETEWYYSAISFVCQRGLMLGTDDEVFSPNAIADRGMIVTMLHRLAKEPQVKGETGFSDVGSNSYFSRAVAWAYDNGLVMGIGNNLFAPDSGMTREQLITVLYRYAVLAGQDTGVRGDVSGYKDSGEISGYAIDAMQWAIGAGLIKGRSSSEIVPKGYITRAELATVLQRFITMK